MQFHDDCSTPSYIFHQKRQKLHSKITQFAYRAIWPPKTRKWSIEHRGPFTEVDKMTMNK